MLTITPKKIARIIDIAAPFHPILTVGYGGLHDAHHLRAIVDALGPSALVVDVRKVNAGARVNKLWWQSAIIAAVGAERYEWKGNVLGGLSKTGANVKPEGLAWIHDTHKARRLLLLCACEPPQSCHRHQHIFGGMIDAAEADDAAPRVPLTGHLYADVICDAADMLRATDAGTDDEGCDTWDEDTAFESLAA